MSHDRALQRTPDDVKAWNNRGVALGNLERHEEALASFDHALELDPDDAGVWYNRGIALGDLGRYEEALSASDKSITAGIQLPDAFFDRIEYLIALGRWDEGVSALDDTLQRFVEARENASRVAEYILDRLLQRAGDAARWPAHVVTLLEVYGKHDALIALGQGLVRAIATLVSPMIADTAAREWLRVWREAAGSSVEMDLPLRLLDAAVSYHTTKDRRALLTLSIEERSIIQPMLGVGNLLDGS